jgi:hypothetical protein
MGDQGRDGAIGRGEVLTLLQRSARRREYELRRDGALLGWLRLPSGSVLCLLGGFLALRELQAEVDASAAVGGIVATGAG